MIVVRLPPPSSYHQVILPQPSWKQDISITRPPGIERSRSNNAVHPQHTKSLSMGTIDTKKTNIEPRRTTGSAGLAELDTHRKIRSEIDSLVNSEVTFQHQDHSSSAGDELPEPFSRKKHHQCRVRLPTIDKRDVVSRTRCGPNSTRDHSTCSTASKSSSHTSLGSSLSSWSDSPEITYPSAIPSPLKLEKSNLRTARSQDPTMMTRQKTLEMYRANVKKTTDVEALYSFAILLIDAAQEFTRTNEASFRNSHAELLAEARQILQRLADKGYPYAQYYLADGHASGLFHSKGKFDDDKALPLFIAAGKHGHAEAGYRAGCCFELGWGTRVDHSKAIQFYRQSASKSHLGAMTRLSRAWIFQDLGNGITFREGFKWLKRAAVSANKQYNTAPYDLGCLHETGYGDDIFKDENYAVQLFLQAAKLDHADAAFKLGQAYEFGKLGCQQNPALSVQFYAMAAAKGHAQAMFAICAWYMVGIEPILEIDEVEAYEWAKKAAQLGLVQAQYAVGYFTEVGIGIRSNPLEANAWYVLAAAQGDERAAKRLSADKQAASCEESPRSRRKSKGISKSERDGSPKQRKISRTRH